MLAAIPIDLRRQGHYALLELALPGEPVHPVGVLLLDPGRDRVYSRLIDRWDEIQGPQDEEYLRALAADLEQKAEEMGGRRFFDWLEDTLSNVLRVTDPENVAVDSYRRVLDRLFEQHVGKLEIAPWHTHLPLYSLRAAATRFGDDQQVEEEDWVAAPPDLRLSENMFLAHVVGRSMEPRIPDGSLNVFRAPVVGSRQGKIVLVELFGQLDASARYSIKRYTSRKILRGPVNSQDGSDDAGWEHASIRLEPLNPEFPSFELTDGEFRVIAEWVRTLD